MTGMELKGCNGKRVWFATSKVIAIHEREDKCLTEISCMGDAELDNFVVREDYETVKEKMEKADG
jgi:hypothetical protein